MRILSIICAVVVAGAIALYVWGDRLFVPAAVAESSYALGTVIQTADLTGEERPYFGEGWSVTEDSGVWTDGPKATMSIPLEDVVTGDLTFAVSANPLVDDVTKEQLIIVSADGKKVGEWLFSSADLNPERSVTIPQSAVSSGKLNLTFDLPDAVKVTGGDRELALFLKSFVVREAP